ncbi:SRPBCC family protein [Calothrix rhizosoleniae]|uniref:SRPBCC family protein n=1 Tax=Calothrix rhizosoleniae TaxID=888997 RepID=UPI0038990C4C
MMISTISDSLPRGLEMLRSQEKQNLLIQGEIFIQTSSHTAWGGAVTACMYLPLLRSQVWQQLTDYPRWVQYFPDLTRSEIMHKGEVKRIYQAAQKAFLFFTAQVEIYLNVVEVIGKQIQFNLERGSFKDFNSNLELQDYGQGTILTYTVKATPEIPVPSILIQQAMNFDLPTNMRKMRQVICKSK